MLQKILRSPTNLLAGVLLRLMAANVNYRVGIRRYLLSGEGWMNFIVGVSTQNGSVEQAISFQNGHAKVLRSIPADVSWRRIVHYGADCHYHTI